MVLSIDGQLWTVVKFQHVNPGKGAAFVRTSLKNVLTGRVVDRTLNAGVRVETASVDKREMQYLYRDGDYFVFMDTETYEQIQIPQDTVGKAVNFLLESGLATVAVAARASSLASQGCSRSNGWPLVTTSRTSLSEARPCQRVITAPEHGA